MQNMDPLKFVLLIMCDVCAHKCVWFEMFSWLHSFYPFFLALPPIHIAHTPSQLPRHNPPAPPHPSTLLLHPSQMSPLSLDSAEGKWEDHKHHIITHVNIIIHLREQCCRRIMFFFVSNTCSYVRHASVQILSRAKTFYLCSILTGSELHFREESDGTHQ